MLARACTRITSSKALFERSRLCAPAATSCGIQALCVRVFVCARVCVRVCVRVIVCARACVWCARRGVVPGLSGCVTQGKCCCVHAATVLLLGAASLLLQVRPLRAANWLCKVRGRHLGAYLISCFVLFELLLSIKLGAYAFSSLGCAAGDGGSTE